MEVAKLVTQPFYRKQMSARVNSFPNPPASLATELVEYACFAGSVANIVGGGFGVNLRGPRGCP